MWAKVKRKYQEIDIHNLDNILLVISLIIFLVSLFFIQNNFLLIFVYLFIYELSNHINENKYLIFIKNFILIIILGFVLMTLTNINLFSYDYLRIFRIIIKVFIYIEYFFIVSKLISYKRLKYIKGNPLVKKYTFKELRKKHFNRFLEVNKEIVNNYVTENNIKVGTDSYELIYSNLENKTINDLEEYVCVNYLRFYKNKRFHKVKVFDIINVIFIVIHIVILLLAIFVR